MAKKILNSKENTTNDSLYLLKHWVGKEAYVKYIGTGIIDDFNGIDLSSIQKKNNYISIINKDFIMYAFSKNKIDTSIKYYNEEEIL